MTKISHGIILFCSIHFMCQLQPVTVLCKIAFVCIVFTKEAIMHISAKYVIMVSANVS